MAPNSSRNSIVLFVGVAFIVGAALALLSTFRGDDEDLATPNSEAAAPATPGQRAASDEVEIVPPVIPADFMLQAAETAVIRSSEFPHDRPVRLGLILPVPATRFEPLRAKIVDTNGRTLDAKASVQGAEKKSANLEIETDWLSPGRYLIHLTTQELSHLPLRRYPLEVR
ncbi:MAG: hypothetical protein JRG89_02490 [Deltaproteobacteria bacterium]|nr:hypothetical protein [Deltaproteobacteria bacterium]MBW2387281.1 hypothetical protein [Deltaproteobacteria bacterium]MBW2724479.1 hypothetical protein [Deltaproteobacteria bacterium]